MTEAEYEGFSAEPPIPVPAEELVGRIVQGQIIKKESGWPGVEEVLPARRRRSK
jgi:hypothetical protein